LHFADCNFCIQRREKCASHTALYHHAKQQQQQWRFTHSPELVVKTEDRRRMAQFPLSTSGENGEEGRLLRRLLIRRDVARRSRMAQTLAE
jgi:hypothetical protein